MNSPGFARSTVSKLHELICEISYYTLFKFGSSKILKRCFKLVDLILYIPVRSQVLVTIMNILEDGSIVRF
jgi:hypothetical protein